MSRLKFFETLARMDESSRHPEGLSEKDQAAENLKVLNLTNSSEDKMEAKEKTSQDFHLCLESIGRSFSFKYPTNQFQKEGRWIIQNRFYHILASENECWKNLLWKALMKGISVDEFIILERILVKKWSRLEPQLKLEVVEIFVLINTRKGLNKYNSRLHSAKRGLISLAPLLDDLERDRIISDFVTSLKLPNKGSNISFEVLDDFEQFRKPPPLPFIGVGYKDKGSLKDTPTPKYSPEDFAETSASFFEEFSKFRKHSRW